jgi:hypothetical protein
MMCYVRQVAEAGGEHPAGAGQGDAGRQVRVSLRSVLPPGADHRNESDSIVRHIAYYKVFFTLQHLPPPPSPGVFK